MKNEESHQEVDPILNSPEVKAFMKESQKSVCIVQCPQFKHPAPRASYEELVEQIGVLEARVKKLKAQLGVTMEKEKKKLRRRAT